VGAQVAVEHGLEVGGRRGQQRGRWAEVPEGRERRVDGASAPFQAVEELRGGVLPGGVADLRDQPVEVVRPPLTREEAP